MRLLARHGASVDADVENETCLMMACQDNLVLVVAALLESKADIDRRDNAGKTALIHAASSSNCTAELITMLLNAGASIQDADFSGRDALLWATQTNNEAARAVLVHLI